MESKFCRDCRGHRPVAEFTRNARARDGLAFYCKVHAAERSLASRERRRTEPRLRRVRRQDIAIPDNHKWCGDRGVVKPLSQFVRTRASTTGYGSYCLPRHSVRCRTNAAERGGYRTYHLSQRYGITAEEADLMFSTQDGLCAVCPTATAAHVDHDHATGVVRELLCFNCNGGLGQFRDDPAVLRAAADYVERHRARQAAAGDGSAGSRPGSPGRPGAAPVGSAPRRSGRAGSAQHGGQTSRDSRQQAAGEADA